MNDLATTTVVEQSPAEVPPAQPLSGMWFGLFLVFVLAGAVFLGRFVFTR